MLHRLTSHPLLDLHVTFDKKAVNSIRTFIMLLLSLPVGTCSCERSLSSLRQLKTWCHNLMSSECLDSIAVGSINQEHTSPPIEVLKVWDLKIEELHWTNCHEYCYH